MLRSEKWCTASAKCQGFDYFNISSSGQKCGKSSFLGWLGCADFKDSVSEVTANQLNTLYVKPPYKPGKPGQAPPPAPPTPAPARQCYTRNPITRAIYVMTNGWPDELVFPDGILHASPAPTVSLLGLAPGAAPQSYKTTARGASHAFAAFAALHRDTACRAGNATVISVPAVALNKLPAASVAGSSFVFKLSGARAAGE